MNPLYPFNRHTRLRESLSAYLDAALSERERATIEAHVSECEACRAEVEGLRAASAALRAVPAVAVPRSFAVTPEMVSRPAPVRPIVSPVLNTAVRLSAASLAVALAAVVVIDRTGTDGNGDEAATMQAARSLEETEAYRAGDAEGDVLAPSVGLNTDDTRDGDMPAATPGAFGGVESGENLDAGAATAAPGERPSAEATGEPIVAQRADDAEEESVEAPLPDESRDGIGVIGVLEVVLAMMFGSAVGLALALAAAGGRGTKRA